MKPEIKQRIEQINNGQVPNGYKKTEFGVFPCDWVTDKTFGDLFSFYGGLGKSRDELSENGVEYLHYGDMHRADFNIASIEQYSKLPKYDTNLKGDESYLMQDGDVAFLDASEDLEGTSRAVLINNPDNKPFIAGLHIIHGKSKGNELSKYYKQYITQPDYIKKQFQKFASGFKVYGINRNTITKVKCAYPESNSEQEKIAEILMKWDEAIELQEKYIEKLKLLKSAYLSNMFPRGKEKKPKVRFHGFSDDWEQRKFGELLQTLPFKSFLKEPEPGGKYEIIQQGNDPIIGFANGSPCNDYQETIIFGDHTLSLYKPKRPFFVATDGVRIVKGAQKTDGFYLLSLLERYKPQNEGYKRYYRILSDTYCFFTCNTDEQKQIGIYFKCLDNFITIHQDKLEKIKTQRKVLQQYLLNGIVRVSR